MGMDVAVAKRVCACNYELWVSCSLHVYRTRAQNGSIAERQSREVESTAQALGALATACCYVSWSWPRRASLIGCSRMIQNQSSSLDPQKFGELLFS